MPNPTNPEIYSLPEDKVLRLEMLPYPAVSWEEHFNTNSLLELQRFSLLVQHVIGPVRVNGFSIERVGNSVMVRAGLLFFREFIVREETAHPIGNFTSGTAINVILKVDRVTKTQESHPEEVQVEAEGRTLSGPNHQTFTTEYIVQSASPPTGTSTTHYLHLATINANGDVIQHVPDRARLFHEMAEGEEPLTNRKNLLENNEFVTVPSSSFPTLSSALRFLSRYRPLFNGGLARVTIQSGFTISEQIFVENMDLSWIHIHGSHVTVDTSALTRSVSTNYGIGAAAKRRTYYPLFYANNGKLPTFRGTLFEHDGVNLSNTIGMVIDSGSSARIWAVNRPSGFDENWPEGIYIGRESSIIGEGGWSVAAPTFWIQGGRADLTRSVDGQINITDGGELQLYTHQSSYPPITLNGETDFEYNVRYRHGIVKYEATLQGIDRLLQNTLDNFKADSFKSGTNSNGSWVDINNGDIIIVSQSGLRFTNQSGDPDWVKSCDWELPYPIPYNQRLQNVTGSINDSHLSRGQVGEFGVNTISNGVCNVQMSGYGTEFESWGGFYARVMIVTIKG